MALVTLARCEWAAILEDLNTAYRDEAPPGLGERIAALLGSTPAAWPDQACKLELADLAAMELVQAIVQRRRQRSRDTLIQWQEQASIAEAEQIIRDHQHRIDDR